MKIIDAHVHLASWPTLASCKGKLTYSFAKYHINASIISHADCVEYNNDKTIHKHEKSTLACLIEVLDYCNKDPNRYAAIWIRPSREKGPSKKLKEFILKHLDKIKALKVHPWASKMKMTDPKMKPWIEWQRELGLPMIVHTAADEYSDIKYLKKVADANPDLRYVAAHIQLCSDNKAGIKALSTTPNLYGDTAWVPMKVTDYLLRHVSPDKVMFGTDNPIDGRNTYANPLIQDYFKNATKLPKKLYEGLMGGNASKFYGI